MCSATTAGIFNSSWKNKGKTMHSKLVYILFSILILGACGSELKTKDADAGFEDTSDMGTDIPYLLRLKTVDDFEVLAEKNAVKYLANLRTPKKEELEGPLVEDIYWISSTIFPWHYEFIASFDYYSDVDLQIYSRWVLYENLRRFYGGVLQYWPDVKHPKTSELGVYSFTVYTAAGHTKVSDIEWVYNRIKSTVDFAPEQLVFTTEYAHQKDWLRAFGGELDKLEIPFMFPEDLAGASPIVYSAGEGYGTLRITPKGERLEDYGPFDIVIAESAPNDISIVQALITQDPQNELSHTNLRLREKRVPNVALSSIYEYENLDQFENKLVHVIANEDVFLIENTTLAEAQAYWDSRKIDIPDVKADLSVETFEGYATMKNSDALAYGAKAANLGELYSILPSENRNPGFGIPFSAYVQHIESANLGDDIVTLLNDPRMKTDAEFKRSELKKLRKKIKDAPIPEAFLRSVETQIVDLFGASHRTVRMRFRSSTNVEDLDEITGAGLYSSKSGCLADDFDGDEVGPSLCLSPEEKAQKERLLAEAQAEFTKHPDRSYLVDIMDDLEGDLTDEKPVSKALGKVWASLWNDRAFDERNYYGIDHQKAYMAIAVNASFVLEKANGVALTELRVDEGNPLYRLNSQTGEESVVQPDNPNAIGEILTFRRSGENVDDVKILVRSSLKGDDEQIWTQAQLDELGGLLFLAHDHFANNVYGHIDKFSLDVEIKLTSDDRIVLKQARPFLSAF